MATLLLLPPYLVPLPESNPAYAGLNSSAYDFAYGPKPGDGNLKEFEIVSFTAAHDAYRLYGGNATECGYWWILAGETTATAASSGANCFPQDPANVDFTTYAQDLFAVCPEWNSGTFIRRCTIPIGYNAIVGIGQSVNCSTTDILTPNQNVLQLNGNVCDAAAAAAAAAATGTPTSSPTTTSASTRLYRRPESQNITLNRQSNGTANDDDDDVDDDLLVEAYDDDSGSLENTGGSSNATTTTATTTTTTAPSSLASTTVSSAACVSCNANQENLFLSECVIMCPTSASPASLSPIAPSPAASSASTASSSINNNSRPYYYTTGLGTMMVAIFVLIS